MKLLNKTCSSYSAHAELPSVNRPTYRITNYGLRKRGAICNHMETHTGRYSFLDRRGCLGAKFVVSKLLMIPLGRGIGIKRHVLRELQLYSSGYDHHGDIKTVRFRKRSPW